MENISSRKNKIITHARALGSDRVYRRDKREYLCEGEKLLDEALRFNVPVTFVLWGGPPVPEILPDVPQYAVSPELLEYASPLKNSPGPLFGVKMVEPDPGRSIRRAVVLENVQDPGNIGTAIRTANALGIDAVALVGACADPYNPKAVRAAMGALFRETLLEADLDGLRTFLGKNDLRLYGTALTNSAGDIRAMPKDRVAIAIGNEGSGLSGRLLEMCEGEVMIPMAPESESLNAAVAAAIAMWELVREK